MHCVIGDRTTRLLFFLFARNYMLQGQVDKFMVDNKQQKYDRRDEKIEREMCDQVLTI